MKIFVNAAIAICLFAPAAYAGQPGGAFEGLLSAAGPAIAAVKADIPEVPAAVPGTALAAGLADLNYRQADELSLSAAMNGFSVFELDGTRMKTKAKLMEYTAQTLGLPADMDNWDALIDYLGDMPDFHHNGKILVLLRNSSAIDNSDAKLYSELRRAAALSCQNANEWSHGSVVLKFVFVH